MGPILEIGTVDSTGEIGQKNKKWRKQWLFTNKKERKNADNDS